MKEVLGMIEHELGGGVNMKQFDGFLQKMSLYLNDFDQGEEAMGNNNSITRQKLKFEDNKICSRARRTEN